jgi:hypothetical protein
MQRTRRITPDLVTRVASLRSANRYGTERIVAISKGIITIHGRLSIVGSVRSALMP